MLQYAAVPQIQEPKHAIKKSTSLPQFQCTVQPQPFYREITHRHDNILQSLKSPAWREQLPSLPPYRY
jgi:hypothetical protein